MKLRPYQDKISEKANEILTKFKIVCIFAEVRTGKTLMALNTCKLNQAKKVLFITKKKAISSIQDDYNNFGFNNDFNLDIINKESIHKLESKIYDIVIIDEVHGYTSFPKPSNAYKQVKSMFGNCKMIYLSGTPAPESNSQYYHLFNLSNYSPFNQYANFYKWAKEFVNITKRKLGYAEVNDYTDADITKINKFIKPYILTFTQKEAGFTTNVKEHFLSVEMKPTTYKIISKLVKDKIVKSTSTDNVIVADTGAKLQQKVHQLSSGTIKLEDGTYLIIDYSKSEFIQDYFKDNKLAIFYNFKAELQMLKDTFKDTLTEDLDTFNNSNKHIALQIVSGREGINLSKADKLIMFNIQFSAVSYFQAKDRLSTMDRLNNDVYWIFSSKGIERNVYKAVSKKLDYTLNLFKKDYGISK